MKIATWNVNSINKRIKLLLEFLEKEKIDVLCVQELKIGYNDFPVFDLKLAGYNSLCSCENGKNGVAIISKYDMQLISNGFEQNSNREARFIAANIKTPDKNMSIGCVYVPVGGFKDFEDLTEEEITKWNHKLLFLRQFYGYLKKNPLDIVAGDFNMVSKIEDISDKLKQNFICCSPKERKIMYEFEKLGYDNVYNVLYPQKVAYSWWSYQFGYYTSNLGYRLDHILCRQNKFKYSNIDIKHEHWRSVDNASDHAPVVLEFEFFNEKE